MLFLERGQLFRVFVAGCLDVFFVLFFCLRHVLRVLLVGLVEFPRDLVLLDPDGVARVDGGFDFLAVLFLRLCEFFRKLRLVAMRRGLFLRRGLKLFGARLQFGGGLRELLVLLFDKRIELLLGGLAMFREQGILLRDGSLVLIFERGNLLVEILAGGLVLARGFLQVRRVFLTRLDCFRILPAERFHLFLVTFEISRQPGQRFVLLFDQRIELLLGGRAVFREQRILFRDGALMPFLERRDLFVEILADGLELARGFLQIRHVLLTRFDCFRTLPAERLHLFLVAFQVCTQFRQRFVLLFDKRVELLLGGSAVLREQGILFRDGAPVLFLERRDLLVEILARGLLLAGGFLQIRRVLLTRIDCLRTLPAERLRLFLVAFQVGTQFRQRFVLLFDQRVELLLGGSTVLREQRILFRDGALMFFLERSQLFRVFIAGRLDAFFVLLFCLRHLLRVLLFGLVEFSGDIVLLDPNVVARLDGGFDLLAVLFLRLREFLHELRLVAMRSGFFLRLGLKLSGARLQLGGGLRELFVLLFDDFFEALVRGAPGLERG